MKTEHLQSICVGSWVHSPARLFRWAALLVFLVAGCTAADSSGDPVANPLYRAPGSYDFSRNPQLLERVNASAHGYFRFVNVAFGADVCREFEPALQSPIVNLHGDAHLEQYAVTDLGRGLDDFDDSSIGPASIDLIRFGVSILLACRENHWGHEEKRLLGAFLDSYRQALIDDGIGAAEPKVAARIRQGFETDVGAYYRNIESLMEPVAETEREAIVRSMVFYQRNQLGEKPGLARDFFAVKDVGYLRLGIGSALDLKYLVRVEGPSSRSDDDAVLELKEVRELSGIRCVRAETGNPDRILRGQARISYQPFKFPGYLRMGKTTFWVHSWVLNYQALRIEDSFQNPEELLEVITDVGTQLGVGHPKEIASGRDLVSYVDRRRDRLLEASVVLAGKVEDAWVAFKAAAERGE